MSESDLTNPARRLSTVLAGYPAGTEEAFAEFFATGSDAALDRALSGIINHHRPATDEPPINLSRLPGEIRIVDDIGIDSLAVAEMAFVLEDALDVKLEETDLNRLGTIDDLRAIVRRHAGLA